MTEPQPAMAALPRARTVIDLLHEVRAGTLCAEQ